MTDLRARIRRGDCLTGIFQKTPSPHVTELLALAGMDFVVADQEHAPIGRGALDLIALAGRAAGVPVLIRATHASGPAIWPALDMGCCGVVVPHVLSRHDACSVADAMKYARGRGFSPSGRAGAYGTIPAATYRERADAGTVFMAQIEDAEALARLDEIASVPDVDVLFVGPQDLSLSLGCAVDAAPMQQAIAEVVAAARRQGKAAGLFVADAASIKDWHARGVSVFICGSDQGLLLNAARRTMAQAASSTGEDI